MSQGAPVGIVGSTGCSTGQQVHFGVGTSIFTNGIVTPAGSVWGKNPSDPAYGTAVTQGASIGGNYPGLAANASSVQMFIRAGNAIFAKNSIGNGGWVQEADPGNASAIAVGR